METAGGPDENAQDEDEKTSPPGAVRQVDGRRVAVVIIVGGGGSDGPDSHAQVVAVQEPVQVSLIPSPRRHRYGVRVSAVSSWYTSYLT